MKLLEQANTPVTVNPQRGGVDVHFDRAANAPLQQSPRWSAAGRSFCFVLLAPGQSLSLPAGRHYAKVIVGQLENLDRGCLAAPFTVRSTEVTADELVAGASGALFALLTLAPDASDRIDDVALLEFDGVHDDHLGWQSFEDRFAGILDYFDGMDCHMANGFHLLGADGSEVVYVNPWACGQGVDLSTHNHAQPPSARSPAFAEVHWVLAAAADDSGMYRTEAPGAAGRERFPMGIGDEHGPFYDLDDDGRPLFRDNGAVQYPWHGWQGGEDERPGQSYDFVLAFEIAPGVIEAWTGG